MQFFQTPNIDFVSKRRLAYIISSSLILIGIVSLIVRGGPNYGIDFKGGTSIVLKFEQDVSVSAIRETLASIEMGTSEIKRFGTRNEYLIYVAQQQGVTASEMVKRVQFIITEQAL